MIRYILVTVLFLIAGTVSGQILRKGAVVESNEITVSLRPNVDLDDYVDILRSRVAPAIAKAFPGTDVHFTRGVRGDAVGKIGAIWVFESVEVKNKFFDESGQLTPAGEDAIVQLAPLMESLEVLGTATRKSTDWILLNRSKPEMEMDYFEYLTAFCDKERLLEVPVAPASMGFRDPLLQKLVEDISVSVSELIQSGVKEGDPRYPQYVTRIENVKKSLRETVTVLMQTKRKSFQRGGSFGLHVLDVSLSPGVTMDQFLEFMINQYVPEVERHMQGVQVLIMKPRRGDDHQIAWVNYFISERTRDSYWPEPDTPSEEADLALNQAQSVLFELLKLGSWSDDYGVWLIE